MLILVPTPIGNLEDITYRAIRLLNEVDGILAEDTRQTAKLLKHYEISKPVAAFHQHNEHKALARVIERLKNGETLAMVSDAGTPGISDPGFLLVRECLLNDIKVETLPGATAFVPALVNSGLPCDRFVFEGFLPHKKGRQTKFKILAQEERTIVLYESPHRLVKTLGQLIEFFEDDREVCVSRELSKIYEENRRGKCSEVLKHYEEHPPKGEIVLIVAGRS
ncbi:MAG: 16S rRNA (cytidine1402-2'-O)-methyltransferase [Salibacteraceae bacterium]|jgi:16S rRNA (cytidine1402-2'-O)-methyltransferase|tara:strand:- start:614 stop:1279 length:666 start_codon:yes stop_codon:yes gene_type:complete